MRSDSVGDFRHRLHALAGSGGHRKHGEPRSTAQPILGPMRVAPGAMTPAQRRRRDVLLVLAGVVALTFVAAVITRSTMFIALQLLADAALAGYVYLLIQHKQRAPGAHAACVRSPVVTQPQVYAPVPVVRARRHRPAGTLERRSAARAPPRRRPAEPRRWTTPVRSLRPEPTPRTRSNASTGRASQRSSRRGVPSVRAPPRSAPCTAASSSDARTLVVEAAAYVAEMDAAVDGHPDVRYTGYVHDAKKEFAEANLTFAFVAGHAMPTAHELGVDAPAYLNGMAEAASELRRQVLDCLRADDMVESERLLGLMDDVYMLLVTVDYPDALTGGLRRSTDALRAVLERTRGDVTNALVAARLRAAMGDTTALRNLRISQDREVAGSGSTATLDLGLAPPRRISRVASTHVVPPRCRARHRVRRHGCARRLDVRTRGRGRGRSARGRDRHGRDRREADGRGELRRSR